MKYNIGRNDPCWCGSGRKYKHCHYRRQYSQPITTQRYRSAIKKPFDKKYCLHPNTGECDGRIVKAHSIQRNGGLSAIAENGHVIECLGEFRPFKDQKPHSIGIRKASTFTGFCAFHDRNVFSPLDNLPFEGTYEQVFLLMYRALARELFLKRAALEAVPTIRQNDRGRLPLEQEAFQENVSYYAVGTEKALEELKEIKTQLDGVLVDADYDRVSSYTIWFDECPDFLSSAVHQPTCDFLGNRLQTLGDLDIELSWIHYSLIPTDIGGAAVFSWIGDDELCKGFIDTLDQVSNPDLPDAITRYTFEFFENTFISPRWWKSLSESCQEAIMMRQRRYPITPDDCLTNDGIHCTHWHVRSRSRRY